MILGDFFAGEVIEVMDLFPVFSLILKLFHDLFRQGIGQPKGDKIPDGALFPMRKITASSDVDFGVWVKKIPRSGSILLPCFWDSGAGSSGYFWGRGAGSSLYCKVIDVKLEDVLVLDGVGDGVFVQRLLENVFRGAVAGFLTVDLFDGGVLLEDGGAGEAEELGVGEKVFDRLMAVAELGAVALVKDNGHALIGQGGQHFLVGLLLALLATDVALAGLVQGEAELLNGGDDDLVGLVVGKKAFNEGVGVGILLDAVLLKFVEFLASLAVEVLTVDHEEAFVDIGVVLEEG